MLNKVLLCAKSDCKMANSCAKKRAPDTINISVIQFNPYNNGHRFHCDGYEKTYKVD